MSAFSNIKMEKNKTEHKTFKANGTVLLGGVAEVSFNVMSGSKGLFVKLPQRTYTDKEGATKYVPEVKIPDEDTYKAFQKAVLAEYAKLVGGKSASTDAPAAEVKVEDGIPF
jgi:DNA-binding cell septation regulator SpoVG